MPPRASAAKPKTKTATPKTAKPTKATPKPTARAAPKHIATPLGSGDKSVQRHIARKRPSVQPIIREVLALVQEVAPEAVVQRGFDALTCYVQHQRLCSIRAAIRMDKIHLLLSPEVSHPDPEELILEHGFVGVYLELWAGQPLPRETILGCLRAELRAIRRRRRA